MKPLLMVRHPDQAVALLHPVRRKILVALRSPASAAGLAPLLNLSRQLITYHLNTLAKLELVILLEERSMGQLSEKIYVAVADRYLLSPEVLDELAPESEVSDPTSTFQLAAMLQDASGHAAAAEAPVLTLDHRIGFQDRQERIETFQVVANTIQRIARTHDPRGANDPYRLIVCLLPPAAK